MISQARNFGQTSLRARQNICVLCPDACEVPVSDWCDRVMFPVVRARAPVSIPRCVSYVHLFRGGWRRSKHFFQHGDRRQRLRGSTERGDWKCAIDPFLGFAATPPPRVLRVPEEAIAANGSGLRAIEANLWLTPF